MQLIVGSLMLYVSLNVQRLMENVCWALPPLSLYRTHLLQPADNVTELTFIFVLLVTLSATQGNHTSSYITFTTHFNDFYSSDIAVDGEAGFLLSI